MAQKPLTKTQANAAFLKQANHFTRLGTPSKIDTELLLNSLSALLAIHGQKVGFKFECDAVGSFEPTPELTVALEQYMPQMRNLVDVSAHPVIDWSQAPEGATHYVVESYSHPWQKKESGQWSFFDEAHKVWVLYVFQPPCYDYVTIIPRPVTKPTRPEPIEVLNLSVRAQHLLLSAGILTIPDLATKTESELLRIKGLGQKSLAEIMAALQRHIGGQAA